MCAVSSEAVKNLSSWSLKYYFGFGGDHLCEPGSELVLSRFSGGYLVPTRFTWFREMDLWRFYFCVFLFHIIE